MIDMGVIVDELFDLMAAEGVTFVTRTEVGKDLPVAQLQEEFDACVLCGGATRPRGAPAYSIVWLWAAMPASMCSGAYP